MDSHIFTRARGVLESLNRHDCSAALAWCEENRARLRKLKSKLEFTLRVQVRLQEDHVTAKHPGGCSPLALGHRHLM